MFDSAVTGGEHRAVRIAALADIHLGSPAGPGLGWALGAVDDAVAAGARVLIMAGDLVDRRADRRADRGADRGHAGRDRTGDDVVDEAVREAVAFFRHCAGTGLPVLAAWGNHDAGVRLGERLDERLAEHGGLPEGVVFAPEDRAVSMTADGVCFHAVSVAADGDLRDPVPLFPVAVPGGPPHVGVLHTGLTGEHSRRPCLPTTPERLHSRGYERWILGHVHAPHRVDQRIAWVGQARLGLIELEVPERSD